MIYDDGRALKVRRTGREEAIREVTLGGSQILLYEFGYLLGREIQLGSCVQQRQSKGSANLPWNFAGLSIIQCD